MAKKVTIVLKKDSSVNVLANPKFLGLLYGLNTVMKITESTVKRGPNMKCVDINIGVTRRTFFQFKFFSKRIFKKRKNVSV